MLVITTAVVLSWRSAGVVIKKVLYIFLTFSISADSLEWGGGGRSRENEQFPAHRRDFDPTSRLGSDFKIYRIALHEIENKNKDADKSGHKRM